MPAEWFVKTRGRSAAEDYTWRPVTSASAAPPASPASGSAAGADAAAADAIAERGWRGRPWYSLIDDEKPGMLLYDDSRHGTVLIVTGIVSDSQPGDYQHRRIRATMLGSAPPGRNADQRELVAVAVAALRNGLAAHLPVRYRVARGFDVDPESWAGFTAEASRGLGTDAEPRPSTDNLKVLADTPEHVRNLADSLATLYARTGPEALAGRLLIWRTPFISRKDVTALDPRPWRVVGEIVDAPGGGDDRLDPLKLVGDAVHDPLGSAARLVRWTLSIVAGLAVVGVVAYFVVGGSSPAQPKSPAAPPAGWRITATITPPGVGTGSGTTGSMVPLGADEVLGTWITPTGGLLVQLWDDGKWTAIGTPAGLTGTPYSVRLGAVSATDAWLFASTRAADGTHSYALRWDGRALSLAGTLPGSLVVTAADGLTATGVSEVRSGTTRDEPYVVLRWDGTAWRLTRLPPPGGGRFTSISSVAEANAGAIWVIAGVSAPSAPSAPQGTQSAVLLRLNGGTWQRTSIPAPGSGPYSLAADGTGGLWLAGDSTSAAGGQYLRHYADGRWTATPVPARQGDSARAVSLAWLPATKSLLGLGTLPATARTAVLAFTPASR